MMTREEMARLFRERGIKVTPQRLAVYEILAQTKSHPSADQIFRLLQAQNPAISLSTVYKTLDTLRSVGLISLLNVGEDSHRYDGNPDPHGHLVCTSCHRVDDLDEGLLGDVSSLLQRKSHYRLSALNLYLYGLCPDCQAKLIRKAE